MKIFAVVLFVCCLKNREMTMHGLSSDEEGLSAKPIPPGSTAAPACAGSANLAKDCHGLTSKNGSDTVKKSQDCLTAETWSKLTSHCSKDTEKYLRLAVAKKAQNVIVTSTNPVKDELDDALSSFTEDVRNLLMAFKNSTFRVLAKTFRLPPPEVESLLNDFASKFLAPSGSAESQHRFLRNLVAEFYDELFFISVRHTMKVDAPRDVTNSRRCLSELRHHPVLMPFGHYPSLFEMYFKRSLGAARTFISGLDLVSQYLNVTVDLGEKCLARHSVKVPTNCSYCQVFSNIPTCAEECLGVVRGCLIPDLGIAGDIEKLSEATSSVKAELSSATIFETILPSLVSKSMLKVIETSHSYRHHVVKKCGFRRANGSKSAGSHSADAIESPRQKLSDRIHQSIDKLKVVLRRLHDLILALPLAVCTYAARNLTEIGLCWNGTSLQWQNISTPEIETRDSAREHQSGPLFAYNDISKELHTITRILSQYTDDKMMHHRRDSSPPSDRETSSSGLEWVTFRSIQKRPPDDEDKNPEDDEDDYDDADDDDDDGKYDENRYDQNSGDQSGWILTDDVSSASSVEVSSASSVEVSSASSVEVISESSFEVFSELSFEVSSESSVEVTSIRPEPTAIHPATSEASNHPSSSSQPSSHSYSSSSSSSSSFSSSSSSYSNLNRPSLVSLYLIGLLTISRSIPFLRLVFNLTDFAFFL